MENIYVYHTPVNVCSENNTRVSSGLGCTWGSKRYFILSHPYKVNPSSTYTLIICRRIREKALDAEFGDAACKERRVNFNNRFLYLGNHKDLELT